MQSLLLLLFLSLIPRFDRVLCGNRLGSRWLGFSSLFHTSRGGLLPFSHATHCTSRCLDTYPSMLPSSRPTPSPACWGQALAALEKQKLEVLLWVGAQRWAGLEPGGVDGSLLTTGLVRCAQPEHSKASLHVFFTISCTPHLLLSPGKWAPFSLQLCSGAAS